MINAFMGPALVLFSAYPLVCPAVSKHKDIKDIVMKPPAVSKTSAFNVSPLDLKEVDAAKWDALLPAANPFISHAFLSALEESGAVSAKTGWWPAHAGVWEGVRLVAALPCYVKSHSWGEYVFDWQWADAWEQASGDYYPKMVSAIPFTPSSGPRLLHAADIDITDVIDVLIPWLEARCGSSWHLLFPQENEEQSWLDAWPKLMQRRSVQYHWHNRGYRDFDDFLSCFTSKRRKEVRRERRKVAEQGFTLRRLSGNEIDLAALRHFYRCYQITYLERGQTGYLPFSFFERVCKRMPQHISLVQALHPQGQWIEDLCDDREEGFTDEYAGATPVAVALFFHDEHQLYGRYWGSEVAADSLHFEVCYYQGIELAIERGYHHFDPGTQGEHKIPRGFEPRFTYSAHWITAPPLRKAIDDFLQEEHRHTEHHLTKAVALLPFKQDFFFKQE